MKLIAAFALSLALLPVAPRTARAEGDSPTSHDPAGSHPARSGDGASKTDEKRPHGAHKSHASHHRTAAHKAHAAPTGPRETTPKGPAFDDRKIAAVKVAPSDDGEVSAPAKTASAPDASKHPHAVAGAKHRKSRAKSVSGKQQKSARHADGHPSAKKTRATGG